MRFWIPLLVFSFALQAQTGVTVQPVGQNAAGAQTGTAAPSEDLCAIQGQVFNSATTIGH